MPTAKPEQVESIILTHFVHIIANGNENCILIIHFFVPSNLQNVVSLLQKRIGFALVTRNGVFFAPQKILNYFAKRTLYTAWHRFNSRGATHEGPTKTTLATCSALPFKNLGKLMSFHWHPHNKGIYKAALMFSGKLYSSVVPNQPVAADFISLVTNLQRELKTLPTASFHKCFSTSEIALSSFLIKDLSIIARLSKM